MSDYTSWYVGMKVVCVKTGPWDSGMPGEVCPACGEVYTIRDIVPPDEVDSGIGIRLVEIVNPEIEHWVECSFLAGNFRPVQTRKTDISIFEAMLNPLTTRETA